LYNYFIDKLKEVSNNTGVNEEDLFIATNNIDDLPEIDKFDKNLNNLIIIDDFVGDSTKNLKKISNYFIRSRTFNTSIVFITQSYFEVPKIIRINTDYIVFKRTNDIDDLRMIIRKYFKGEDDKIVNLYEKVMKLPGNENFILFDLKSPEPSKRIRINWGKL